VQSGATGAWWAREDLNLGPAEDTSLAVYSFASSRASPSNLDDETPALSF